MPRPRGGIRLNGKSYKLYEEKNGANSNSAWDAPINEYQARIKDELKHWQDWSGGAFWSRSGGNAPANCYAMDEPGYSWASNLFTPPGRYREVAMPPNALAFPTPVRESRQPIDGCDFTDDDGVTRFYFTVGSYICRITGSGEPEDVLAVPGYQFISLCQWERSGAAVLLASGYWDSGVSVDNRCIWEWDGAAWRRGGTTGEAQIALGGAKVWAPMDRGHLRTVYWKPRGNLAGLGGSTRGGTGSLMLVGNSTATPHKVAWCALGVDYADPREWSAEYPVGTAVHGIERISGSPNHLYFFKKDGIRDMDENGDTPNLTPHWADAVDSGNGQAGELYDTALVGSHASGLTYVEVAEQTPAQRIPIIASPGDGCANETPNFGRTPALGQHGGRLFAINYNGTDSYLNTGMKRSRLGIDGPGPLLWHGAEAVYRGVAITMMAVSHASGYPTLYSAGLDVADGRTPRLFKQSLPKAATPLQDLRNGTGLLEGGFEFHPVARKYLPVEDMRYPTTPKVLWGFEVQCDGLGSGVWADIIAAANLANPYALDGDHNPTGYTDQGTLTTSPGGPIDPSDDLVTGTHLAVVINLQGRATMPPIFRALAAQMRINVALAEERVYTLEVTAPMTLDNLARKDVDIQSQYLEIAALQEAGPVTLEDEFGEELAVDILPGSVRRDIKPHPINKDTFVGVVVFRPRMRTRPFEWDAGHQWDQRRSWRNDTA